MSLNFPSALGAVNLGLDAPVEKDPVVAGLDKVTGGSLTEEGGDGPVHDVVIIGSGPAGWTAAVYAARANLEPVLFAGAVTAGGALMNTTEVENFPGFPQGILGPELMANMQAQAEKFGTDVRYEDIVSVDLTGPVKAVTNEDGETTLARAVILANGSEYRSLGLPGEQALSGKGVSYCATCDGFFFSGQHIAVVGGGDSAVTEALFLTRYGAKVTLIHRRHELRASKVMADRAKADPKIEIAWNSEVAAVNGEDKVTSLTLRDTVTGEERELDATALFVAIGHDPRTAILAGQVDLDEGGYILVDSPTTRTNLPGVFACGDAVDHTYRQAITAAGTGCSAALDAEKYLADLAAASPEVPDAEAEPSTIDVNLEAATDSEAV